MIEQRNSDIVVFKKQLENSGTKGLVIDLDETLSWTIHYMAGELAKLYGNPQNLSVEELRERIVAHDIPFGNLKKFESGGCKPWNRKKRFCFLLLLVIKQAFIY